MTYILVNHNGKEMTSAYGCIDGCVYTTKENNKSIFCFKSGNLPVACLDSKSVVLGIQFVCRIEVVCPYF